VLNKVDLGEQLSPEDVTLLASSHRLVRISAKERFGLDDLRRAVVAHATDGSTPGSTGPVLTNLRHEDALRKAATSLALARQSVSDCRHPELVAVDVQDAIDHIGSVTGVITCEEVLSRIFSEFCIGK
jgi:tRNA modification GTPase